MITAMTILFMALGLGSLALLAYMVRHALRHDPRRPDQAPPRSHLHEAPPQPWYAAPPRYESGRWAA